MKHSLALLMLLLAVSTQGQEASPRAESNTSNGSISGRVVSESGQPLPNATIYFRALNGSWQGRSTTSDIDGNFRVTGLDSGLYSFSAGLATYVSVPRDPDSPQTYYRVGDTVRIDLMKGGVLTGTVMNSAGEPVIAIRVRAARIKDSNGKPSEGSFGTIERTTDDRGVYRIYGLSPGTYIIQAGGGANQYQPTAFDFDAPTFSPSATRDAAAEVIVRSGEESIADIRYRAEPGHTISGTVKLRGENTSGVNVTLTVAGGEVIAPSGTAFQMPGTRTFSFYGVADGDYDLVAQEVVTASQTQMIADLALSEPKRVTVKGSDISGIELTTTPLATVKGKFVFEASKLQECQNKRRPLLSEMVVNLVRNQQKDDSKRFDLAYLRTFGQTSFPDKEGAFVLRNLRPAQYAFLPKFFARYWYVQSISIGSTGPAKQPVRIDAARNWTTIKGSEMVTGLTITLAEGAASIKGQLSPPEGTTVPSNFKVYLVPAEREKVEDSLRYFMSEIGGDGTFLITNLAPGNYMVSVQALGEKDPKTLEKLRLPDAAEARSQIRRNAEAAKLNVELKPCQNLTDYKLPWKP